MTGVWSYCMSVVGPFRKEIYGYNRTEHRFQLFCKGNREICFLICLWYRTVAFLTLCCTVYLICFPKSNSLRFESPSIKLNKMKMPTLLECVGVGLKLENKHSIELPFPMGIERKKLFTELWNFGGLGLLHCSLCWGKALDNIKLQSLLNEICFLTGFWCCCSCLLPFYLVRYSKTDSQEEVW